MARKNLRRGNTEALPNESKNPKNIRFIKDNINNPNIIAGAYSYYEATGSESFDDCVFHHYDVLGDRLIIGKFCVISQKVKFLMNGANHKMDAVSAYPFYLVDEIWQNANLQDVEIPFRGDTIVGNDVLIGKNVTVFPGVKIGDGAIIGANCVVAQDVPPYHIASTAGTSLNLRKRFSDDLIELLLKLKWWDWPAETIAQNLDFLMNINEEKIEMLKEKLSSETRI